MSTRFDERAEELEGYQDWKPNDVADFLKKNNFKIF